MKVGELREKLAKYKKEELIKIAAEFYKQLPKAKKEALQNLIENPAAKPTPVLKVGLTLEELKIETEAFIINAKEGNYIKPNQMVPKKDRSKWRFLVKRLHKALSKHNRPDKDLGLQAQLLSGLYGVLCQAESLSYFTTPYPFSSVGISKDKFFESILFLIELNEGKAAVVNKGIELMYTHNFGGYYEYKSLQAVFEGFLTIPDLKYQAIEKTTQLLKNNGFAPPKKNSKKSYYAYNREKKNREKKNNNLATLGFAMHIGLFEYDEAIAFFDQHYYENEEEVKLYILVKLLFDEGLKDQIKQQLKQAIKRGVQPRQRLMDLLKVILTDDALPVYFV